MAARAALRIPPVPYPDGLGFVPESMHDVSPLRQLSYEQLLTAKQARCSSGRMGGVATKAPLPEKVSTDHATLVTQLAECAALVRLLVDGKSPNLSQTLSELITQFETFQAETEAHLAEEEQTAMPLMRHHFTPAEWKKHVENIILKNAKPSDLGWLLRQKDPKEQRAWMATIAHIPGPVISFVMVPAIAKFEREVTAPMCALIGGATTYTYARARPRLRMHAHVKPLHELVHST